MSETDCEIEYLDEDAEIVQQCVQSTESQSSYASEQQLLVERDNRRRKRKIYDEDDSDYNPSDDRPESPKRSKKKSSGPVRKNAKLNTSNQSRQNAQTSRTSAQSSRNQSQSTRTPAQTRTSANKTRTPTAKKADPEKDYRLRKKMDIRIPDFEDPLCLPVRALKRTGSDLQRLRNWNNVCLEHFKQCNTILKPEKGETKSSTRSIVLRNVVHKETGKLELAVWSKTCVENQEGVKKSEIFQSILPKYRERKMLNPFNLVWSRREAKFHHVSEVLLTKEEEKDQEMLVAYKPREKLSAVYKYVEDKNSIRRDEEEEPKKCLKEVVCCKVCAPCYQTSWRGAKKNDQKGLWCPVCGRGSVSVYNLLTHLRAHQRGDVLRRRNQIAAMLSKVVDYHYRCRVCLQRFLSIKSLRQHVNTHKGTEMFKCEVGNHMAS